MANNLIEVKNVTGAKIIEKQCTHAQLWKHTHTHTQSSTTTHTQGHSSTLFTGLGAARKPQFTAMNISATVVTVLVLFRVDPF